MKVIPLLLANASLMDKAIKVITKYYPLLIRGAINTIIVALIGTIVGLLIGLLVGGIRFVTLTSDHKETKVKMIIKKIVYFITSCYVEIFRGTPMMVQAMFLFWSLKQTLNWSAYTAAICIISINTGAYMAEIVRSGIQSVDKGQNEGARSIGMTDMQAMFYVILPQAIRNAFPSIGNEFVVNIKDSCVLNCIGFAELFFQAKSIQGSLFDYTGPFLVVGIMYFILTFTTTRVLGKIEEKMNHTHSSIPASDTTANSIQRQRGGFDSWH